ncbi:MAG: RsmB/NOP family class I SAM-dependent RNA methyltransferase [Porphyrobacter sp.]|jgi:16S rRNA (cytosine967-C5)-methyltransferase|nr:RsmB/NOP family class I SAM-dependent RNA methyltransferase [Porphyrobacter sp.]
MTPAARVQSAIDLLDAVIAAARSQGAPADRILADWFKAHRFAGSKDRRAIRDLVYDAIRACGPVPASGRAAMLRLAEVRPDLAVLFDGSAYGPVAIVPGEPVADGGAAPAWLSQMLAASGVDQAVMEALSARAPLDVRVNALKTDRARLALPQAGQLLGVSHGLRFPSGTPVESWPEYAQGLIEVQDFGSQLIVDALPVAPGDTIIDLCAGAGGKTLALAARLGNAGVLIAADTNKRRLGNLAPRAARAGAEVAHTVLLDPGREMQALVPWQASADHVLVDAPCSGSGTWRRSPEARWRLDPPGLARLTALQDHVLDVAAELLRPGGTIGFVTCSLLDAEGADRIAAFLARHPEWTTAPLAIAAPTTAHGHGERLDPVTTGSDGFFVALLNAPC